MNRRKRRKHHPRSPRTQQFAASVLDLPRVDFVVVLFGLGFHLSCPLVSIIFQDISKVSNGGLLDHLGLRPRSCLFSSHQNSYGIARRDMMISIDSYPHFFARNFFARNFLLEIFLLEATPELNMNSSPYSDFLCRTSLGGRREPCCSLVLSHARCHLMQTKLQIYQMIMLHAGSGPLVITGSSQPTRPEGIQYISH